VQLVKLAKDLQVKHAKRKQKGSMRGEWRREDKMLEVRGYRRGRKKVRLLLNERKGLLKRSVPNEARMLKREGLHGLEEKINQPQVLVEVLEVLGMLCLHIGQLWLVKQKLEYAEQEVLIRI
jgi:hypothetical protein